MINIGDMRTEIVLQKPTKVRDSQGNFTITWADMDTIWAKLEPLNSREIIQAKQAQSEINYRIIIWYRRDIKFDWRIKLGTRYFDIDSIINVDELNTILQLLCIERK